MLRPVMALAGVLLFAAAAALGPSTAGALECKQVRGHQDEVPLEPCASPVGLCTIARLGGSIHGDAIFP